MGFIGNLLGGGNNFKAGAGAGAPVNVVGAEGAAKSYDRVEDALAQQRAFTQALQNSGGIQNQQQVFGQLQGIANGTGPNPAEAQLANATSANIAQQAALMGSQRGAGANPALIARQAAMQGANIQQNAAGQAAALQAGQSLNAINAAGNIANNQVASAAQAGQAYTGAEQGTYGQLLNQITSQNNTAAGLQENINTVNGGIAQKQAEGQNNIVGGITGAVGTGLGKVFKAEGGEIPAPSPVMIHLTGSKMAAGGNVGSKLQAGGKVPGKPTVGGAVNSYANDKVKALLSPGEIVLPRSIVQGKNPVEDAAKFVGAILAKNKMRK